MKSLVIGLGNPILGDDGIGWVVAEKLKQIIADTREIEVDCLALGGLSLMERLADYDRVIIIDAMSTGNHPLGSVRRILLSDLPDLSSGHTTAIHDTSLRNALMIGRTMGISLPEEDDIHIVAIEADIIQEFSEILSPPVEAAVHEAMEAVLDILNL